MPSSTIQLADNTAPAIASRRLARTRTRRGFTFTEILFAVLILGIGFILVAAIFPVALRQTQATSEETAAATIAKGGVSYLAKYTTQSDWYAGTASAADAFVHPIGPVVVPGEPVATNTKLWNKLCGNLILPADSRYGWVPIYRQITNQNYVQVILIGVQARNRSFYDKADTAVRSDNRASLVARPKTITTVDSANEQFTFDSNDALAEGTYVVIANDPGGTTTGFIYRLGTQAGGTVWNLAPGNDINSAGAPPSGVTALVVGAGYTDSASTGYSGPTQDVAVYTTFLTLH